MTNIERLREAVNQLQQVFDRDHADLSEQWGNDATLVRTTDGRYVLLDALVTLVNARTALAQTEAPQVTAREAMVVQSGDVLLLRVDGTPSRDVLDEYTDAIAGPLKERLGLKDVVLLGGIEDWAVKR